MYTHTRCALGRGGCKGGCRDSPSVRTRLFLFLFLFLFLLLLLFLFLLLPLFLFLLLLLLLFRDFRFPILCLPASFPFCP